MPQRAALEATAEFLGRSGSKSQLRGYFDMATGTGKTGLFAVITRFAQQVAQQRGAPFRTVIVEPTTLLLDQTQNALVAAAPELRDQIGIFGGGDRDLTRPVTIMTYRAWNNLAEQGHLHNATIGLHINDEAHYGLSERRQNLINTHLGDTLHLGVTATAQYDLEKTLERTHRNMIYKISLSEAVRQGYLAEYAHVQFSMMRLMPNSGEPGGADAAQESAAGQENKVLAALKRRAWARSITHTYAEGRDEISGQPLSDKIAVMYGANTQHADLLAAALNANPILRAKALAKGFEAVAISIHSVGHNPGEQKRRLDAFTAGKYMVATGDKKFKEGFDYPPVKFVASYPGNSPVDAAQEIGRGTRPYKRQGLVIAETIPYFGSADPRQDKLAQREVLANCVTALDILGDANVFGPGRDVKHVRKTPRTGQRPELVLAPGITVTTFTTLEETHTFARLITQAQTEKERDILTLTAPMLAELRSKTKAKGADKELRLWRAVNIFRASQALAEIGLSAAFIHSVVSGEQKTLRRDQWQRLHDALDTLPDHAPVIRPVITAEKLADLRAALVSLGNPTVALLQQAVELYEKKRGLSGTELTTNGVQQIIKGDTAVDPVLAQRLQDALDAPDTRKIFTPDPPGTLQGRLDALGKPGPTRLFQAVQNYETRRGLPSVGLSQGIIQRMISGDLNSVAPAHRQRLEEVLAAPEAQHEFHTPVPIPQHVITLTAEKREFLRSTLTKLGNPAPERLHDAVVLFEKDRGLRGGVLTPPIIAQIIGGTTPTVGYAQWERLHNVIESGKTIRFFRVDITKDMRAALQGKLDALENPGTLRLLELVELYEKAQKLPSTGWNATSLHKTLRGDTPDVLPGAWQTLLDAFDAEHRRVVPSIVITTEMLAALHDKLDRLGNPAIRSIREIMGAYKNAQGKRGAGIDETALRRILAGKITTVLETQWQRLNNALDIRLEFIATKPEYARNAAAPQTKTIRFTPNMRKAFMGKCAAKGEVGIGQIMALVWAHQAAQKSRDPGPPKAVVTKLLTNDLNKIDADHWRLLNTLIDALPDQGKPAQIIVSAAMLAELQASIPYKTIKKFGGVAGVVRSYQERHLLPDIGLSAGLVDAVIAGQITTFAQPQWQRLRGALEMHNRRMTITDPMFATFEAKYIVKDWARLGSFAKALRDYEEEQRLPHIGLTTTLIHNFRNGIVRSMEPEHWQRLNQFLDSLPDMPPAQRQAAAPSARRPAPERKAPELIPGIGQKG